MRKHAPVLVVLLFVSLSCTSGVTKNEVWNNDKIDPKVREAITGLDNEVYKLMSANDYASLSKLFSDSLLDQIDPSFEQKFMPQIQKVIKGRPYKLFGRHYARTVKVKDTIRISSPGNKGYTIKLLSANNETCVSMLVAGRHVNEVMLTVIYTKINDKWKIGSILGEDYSLNGKSTLDHYADAQALEQKGYMIDAINVMSLANYCQKPAGRMFRYNNAEEMAVYSDSLTARAKAQYPFPYTVNELATKPSVFNIHYEPFDSTLAPMIMYKSSIEVSDTIKLKTENEMMQKSIGAIFNGVDKNNKVILYRAYNTLPDGKNDPRYYGYIQKMN